MTMRSGRKKKRPRGGAGGGGEGGGTKAEEEVQTSEVEDEEGIGSKTPAAKKRRGGDGDAGVMAVEEDVVMEEEEGGDGKVAEKEEVSVVGVTTQPAASATATVGRVELSLPSETAAAAASSRTTGRRVSPVKAALDGARSGGRKLVSMFAAGRSTAVTSASSTTSTTTTTAVASTATAAPEVSTTAVGAAVDAATSPPAPRSGGRLLQSLSRVYPTPIRPSVMSYLDRFSGTGGGGGGEVPGGGEVNGGRQPQPPPSPPPMVEDETAAEGTSPSKGRARAHAIVSNPYLWTGLFLTVFVVSSGGGSILTRLGEASAGLGGPGGYYGNLLGRYYHGHELTQPADPEMVLNVELVAEEGGVDEETEGGAEEAVVQKDETVVPTVQEETETGEEEEQEQEEEPADEDTAEAAANRTSEIRAEILRIRNERLLERYDADLRLLGELRPSLEAMRSESEQVSGTVEDEGEEGVGGAEEEDLIASEMEELRSDLDRRGEDLRAWEDKLVRAEAALMDLSASSPAGAASSGREGKIRAARDALRDLAAVSPVELLALADASSSGDGGQGVFIRLPKTGENCSEGAEAEQASDDYSPDGDELSSPSSFVGEEDVAAAEGKMRDLAESTVGKVEGDGERVREWARQEIEDARGRVLPPDDSDDEDDEEDEGVDGDEEDASTAGAAAAGMSREKVEEEIRHRLDAEDADRTGTVDFASARQGGTVIASKTSPSYVDMLPLFNRLMARLGLRFYGHPPTVALSVTDPPDALGQCWAFRRDPVLPPTNRAVRESGDTPDDYYGSSTSPGRLASLTVRLARPVKVSGVVVEHPLGVEGANPKSAIREFRVLGYEGEVGEGTPWLLGSFMYDIVAPRSLQEFAVARTDDDGREVPHIKSVTLAVDSNWGYDYSCLYRFRVHGTP